MITAVMLLVCVSSAVRADEVGDESSVAAMVKTMVAKQELQIARQEEQTVKKDQAILALTDALKAKTEQAHVQLTTGGEVVELVSAADVKALVEQTEACARRNDAQDAEIGMISEELKSGRAPSGERSDQLALELDATKAKLAVQATQIKELSATVAQLLATPQARPMPVDAAETAAAARRLQTGSSGPSVPSGGSDVRRQLEGQPQTPCTCFKCGESVDAGFSSGNCGPASGGCSSSVSGDGCYTDCATGCSCATKTCTLSQSSPSPPPPSPPLPPPLSPPLPPAWPPLPATANELRMAGRHTAIAFNTGVDGIEAYRCVGVADGKLTCSGELRAADFRTADGISLAELARFAGMVPPAAPPPTLPPSPPLPLLPAAYPGDLNAWYCSGAFDVASSTWQDCSGNGNTATLSGSGLAEVRSAGHGAASEVLALSGTTSSVISFGPVIKSEFTVCSVTRYTGGAKERILQGGGANWLHGHWGGQAGVAYYEGWKTAEQGSVSPDTDWVVMCGTNAGSQLTLVNGVDVGTATGGESGVSLFVNAGDRKDTSDEKSDFAIAEVVVWPRGLTSEEMRSVSDHLMNCMASPPPPPPLLPPP